MPNDLLCIRDLSIWTQIGTSKEEQLHPQQILVSVEFPVDAKRTADTDDLSGSIDYATICADIQLLAQKERSTIEKLAEDIASLLLDHYPLTFVTVTVTKFPALGTKEVHLCITRTR